jgi:spermidine/putrescine transport system ATP-binding protein
VTGGEVRLHQLAKAFGGVPAVTGIDLDIPGGQFYSLLGAWAAVRPRHCG